VSDLSGVSFSLPAEAVEAIARQAAELVLERLELSSSGRPASPWLTVSEAAELLRCKPQRIYDLRSSGRLSGDGDGDRALIRRDELERYIAGEATGVLDRGRPAAL
jgi:excisionase family DNA binding protein